MACLQLGQKHLVIYALQAYWSQVTIDHDVSTCSTFEPWPMPWVVAACDAAISCGATVFVRADGDLSISSLTRTFKGATRRFAYLCRCPLFQADGPDSKRLRPLWVPQIEAMQLHVCLLNPLSVKLVLEQWGLHCLQLEAPRRRCKIQSTTPSVVSCFSQTADEAHGSQAGLSRRRSHVR